MVSETKLHESFPVDQYLIILLFIRGDLPCKLLSVENQPIEGYIEVNLRKNQTNGCFAALRTQIDTLLFFT